MENIQFYFKAQALDNTGRDIFYEYIDKFRDIDCDDERKLLSSKMSEVSIEGKQDGDEHYSVYKLDNKFLLELQTTATDIQGRKAPIVCYFELGDETDPHNITNIIDKFLDEIKRGKKYQNKELHKLIKYQSIFSKLSSCCSSFMNFFDRSDMKNTWMSTDHYEQFDYFKILDEINKKNIMKKNINAILYKDGKFTEKNIKITNNMNIRKCPSNVEQDLNEKLRKYNLGEK